MTDANSGTRRYLALWFPFLPADRLRAEEPERFARTITAEPRDQGPDRGPEAPLVFVAKVRGALRLCAVDAVALQQGVTPGLTLADARALLPGLRVADMDAAADRHWLQRLARRCTRWCPLVTAVPPDGITLDITGADHLFGGEAGLAAQVEDDLAALGMRLRLAIAASAAAAQALARHAAVASAEALHAGLPARDERAAIRALPVAVLGLGAEAELALRRAGLTTIAAVAARPAASIAARFGLAAVTALRRLIGDEQAPIAPLVQPAPLRFERRFAEPIGHQGAIAACFLDLLRDAAGVLAQRDLGGKRFALTLFRSDGARRRLDIATGQPTRDPALVLRLFDERIGSLADPLDPGFGYDRITLFLPLVEPLAASQPGLDGAAQDGQALSELIDRLSTRLGPGSLRRLVPHDSHVPEQAQLALPAIDDRPLPRWPALPPGEPAQRPLFLFDPPQPVEVIAQVPDGPPHRFRWRRTLHEVRRYEGPERIAAQWWRRKAGEHPGGGGLTRDYYRIEDVQGRRYWIFRHGLYDEKPDPRWYLHGLFA